MFYQIWNYLTLTIPAKAGIQGWAEAPLPGLSEFNYSSHSISRALCELPGINRVMVKPIFA